MAMAKEGDLTAQRPSNFATDLTEVSSK